MRDPFFAPISLLSQAVQPLADFLSLTTLPLHIHEVLFSFLLYNWINIYGAPMVSRFLFPVRYGKLSPDKKLNWDVHVVSLVQSVLICTLALYVTLNDEERKNMTWEERIWGYTGASGLIQGFATGYFLWDLMVTVQNLSNFGPGMFAHAVSALVVFSFGFRPFVNYYGATFILYELSSPFLNFHWFFDKLDMTGSPAQLVNGGVLLFVFFSCRLVWGSYQSVCVYQDVWNALHHVPAAASIHYDTLANATTEAALGNSADPLHRAGVMQFAGDEFCPLWLALTYMGSNIVLNALNFYWFTKMVEAIRKRVKPAAPKRDRNIGVVKSTGPDGESKFAAHDTTTRKRRQVTRSITDDLPPRTF